MIIYNGGLIKPKTASPFTDWSDLADMALVVG
jgi:hypothetical protein